MLAVKPSKPAEAVVIGASAGALDALTVLLPAVSRELDVPIVVVVHLSPRSPSLLPDILRPRCACEVKEPDDKEPVRRGVIWLAPADYHLLIDAGRTFSFSVDEPVKFSRPSIDVLFESAAEVYRDRLVGVVLTGANDDGAIGARAIRRNGGLVLVQDPALAEAPEMPRAALSLAAPQFVGALPQIVETLTAITRRPG
jgi:two-component system chemotaxis response regulator CheB